MSQKEESYNPTLAVPPAEAARMLSVSVRTLAEWRRQGTGPKFKRVGGPNSRIIYRVGALEEFLEEGEGTR